MSNGNVLPAARVRHTPVEIAGGLSWCTQASASPAKRWAAWVKSVKAPDPTNFLRVGAFHSGSPDFRSHRDGPSRNACARIARTVTIRGIFINL